MCSCRIRAVAVCLRVHSDIFSEYLSSSSPKLHVNYHRFGDSTTVVEPKLFVSTPAPASTFKKFQLRLRQQLWNYLLSQILC